MKNNTKKLVFISMLVTQALILSYIETLLPAIPIQGAKIGLANIATVLALHSLDFKGTLLVVISRILLTGLLFGNMASILYAMSGGLLSLIAMYLAVKFFKSHMSLVGISIMGAVFHNMGQLGMAMLVLSNINFIWLLPYLFVIAIPTGIFVGLVSSYLLRYLTKNNFDFRI